jgi:hypothetical protein
LGFCDSSAPITTDYFCHGGRGTFPLWCMSRKQSTYTVVLLCLRFGTSLRTFFSLTIPLWSSWGCIHAAEGSEVLDPFLS